MLNKSFGAFFALVAILCLAHADDADNEDGRIIGGQIITIDKMPCLVQLRDASGHFCGGTLVGPRHVITAGHCLEGTPTKNMTIVGGASTTFDQGVQRKVKNAYLPRKFNIFTKNMDVLVLELDSDMSGENITTCPLCTHTLQPGDLLQVAGWGRTVERGAFPTRLSTVSVPVIPKDECVASYDRLYSVTKSMFCASVPGSKDACTNDSGGPAIYKGELCGIVSWGIGCGRPQFPGVYTDVSGDVLDFINLAIANEIKPRDI